MPTATASLAARQSCTSSRLRSPEIHFESPLRVATLPSSDIADLNITHGRPVRACLRNGWFSSRARVGELAVGHEHLDALVAQDPEAAPGGVRRRVVGGDHDPGDAGVADRVGARRGPARGGSRARARRRSSRPRAPARRVADRLDLGVRAARPPGGSPRRSPCRRARSRPRRGGSGSHGCRRAPRGRSRAPAAARRIRWSLAPI